MLRCSCAKGIRRDATAAPQEAQGEPGLALAPLESKAWDESGWTVGLAEGLYMTGRGFQILSWKQRVVKLDFKQSKITQFPGWRAEQEDTSTHWGTYWLRIILPTPRGREKARVPEETTLHLIPGSGCKFTGIWQVFIPRRSPGPVRCTVKYTALTHPSSGLFNHKQITALGPCRQNFTKGFGIVSSMTRST